MANITFTSAFTCVQLDGSWSMASTAAGAAASPAALPTTLRWHPASVPGTVAGCLAMAGEWSIDSCAPLHSQDHWYHLRFSGAGACVLRFAGLATLAEVWLNGVLLLRSENMFVSHELDVTLADNNELYLCFRALDALLARPAKRARWRPAMIVPNTLRMVRTTLLGNMPGWCPSVHAIGPWRAIERIEKKSSVQLLHAQLQTELRGRDTGVITLTLDVQGCVAAKVECAGVTMPMSCSAGKAQAQLVLEGINAWWPHTHGTPHLYALKVVLDDTVFELGKVGFRRVRVERGPQADAFSLHINDVPVFCRGACWTSTDIVDLPGTRAAYAPWLEMMRAANMNMVRVGGTMLYETNAFHTLCDELGLMVWQDFMFANFDYPVADATFEASVRAEVGQFLDRIQASPSLTVLCGGSEVAQQAAMLGLPEESWTGPLFGSWLPQLAEQWRPDVPYVPNSPYGGALPFIANAQVTHYYGVGAYERPLEDARRAEVKFASECLAFANVPEAATLEATLTVPAVHHPLWKQRTPRDLGASWDFEDTRDHYFALLYQLDPALIRRTDPERYLELSRAVTGEVMETVFAEWRRQHSTCAGGLVWNYQDLWPGAGWGVVDSLGEPKAAWYGLRRAFRSVQVAFTDEGVNGLAVHVSNDSASPRKVKLMLQCLRGAAEVIKVDQELELAAHSATELSSHRLIGRFFDITYAYRFGPVAHDVSVATLFDALNGEQLAEAFHFPQRRDIHPQPMDWQAHVERVGGDWFLHVSTQRFATSVHIRDEHFRPEDNWFHLPPRSERRIRLLPRKPTDKLPDGEVRSLNSSISLRYRAAP